MTDQKQEHDSASMTKKDRKLGNGIRYVLIGLFAFVLLMAVLQATLDTPKKGDSYPPAPAATG